MTPSDSQKPGTPYGATLPRLSAEAAEQTEEILVVEAIMARSRRTQPLDPFGNEAADLDGAHPDGVDAELVFLGRARSSPWVSDDQLARLEVGYQDLAWEREALARLEREKAFLEDLKMAAVTDGDFSLTWSQRARLEDVGPAINGARGTVGEAAAAFHQVTEQASEDIAVARERLVDPTGERHAETEVRDLWAPITADEHAAVLEWVVVEPAEDDPRRVALTPRGQRTIVAEIEADVQVEPPTSGWPVLSGVALSSESGLQRAQRLSHEPALQSTMPAVSQAVAR